MEDLNRAKFQDKMWPKNNNNSSFKQGLDDMLDSAQKAKAFRSVPKEQNKQIDRCRKKVKDLSTYTID
ncbi:MAG: hypothetical protein Q9191_003106 [Dirinaria sp. TL-2023a]